MKIALVHDYLKEFGGAERVFETLSDIFPDAPIYTSLYVPASLGPHRNRLAQKWNHRLHQSFFQYIPFASKLISPLRLLSPLAFRLFDFQTFDLIITSATGAYFPNSLNKGKSKLICYCHTPPRYLYGLPTARDLTKYPAVMFIVGILNHFLRLLDFHWAQNVDQFIANSQTTAARIRKFYRRDSIVINPPIQLPKAPPSLSREGRGGFGEFYLTGGRLASAKRFDIAILACNQLKVPLKVFGRDFAGVLDHLKSIAGPTIEFVGEVGDQERNSLFQNAKAFIFPSDNEDFGMIPLEAMALGSPVVAYRSGGAVETVVENKTGIFFDQLTSDSCASAITRLSKLKITPSACISRAADFSEAKFIKKIKSTVFINPLLRV